MNYKTFYRLKIWWLKNLKNQDLKINAMDKNAKKINQEMLEEKLDKRIIFKWFKFFMFNKKNIWFCQSRGKEEVFSKKLMRKNVLMWILIWKLFYDVTKKKAFRKKLKKLIGNLIFFENRWLHKIEKNGNNFFELNFGKIKFFFH